MQYAGGAYQKGSSVFGTLPDPQLASNYRNANSTPAPPQKVYPQPSLLQNNNNYYQDHETNPNHFDYQGSQGYTSSDMKLPPISQLPNNNMDNQLQNTLQVNARSRVQMDSPRQQQVTFASPYKSGRKQVLT